MKQGRQAADLLGEPAEQDRADQLTDIAGGEDQADLRSGVSFHSYTSCGIAKAMTSTV